MLIAKNLSGPKRTSILSLKLLFVLAMLSIGYSSIAQTVYVTRTGKKYHADGCRYLSQSKIKTTLSDAQDDGYAACSVCKPSSALSSQMDTVRSQPVHRVAASTQCTGTTKAGNRCKRMTTSASGRCYQH